MTAAVFDLMFSKLINVEGGFTDNPKDRGNWTGGKIGVGKLKGTKYGVSAAAYPNLDIKNLTIDDAKRIFQNDYWDKVKADNLPDSLSIIVSDTAYNSGTYKAIKILQQSLGITADGIIGNQTLGAANRLPLKKTIETYTHNRLNFLQSLDSWPTFGKGWTNRANEIEKLALEYA